MKQLTVIQQRFSAALLSLFTLSVFWSNANCATVYQANLHGNDVTLWDNHIKKDNELSVPDQYNYLYQTLGSDRSFKVAMSGGLKTGVVKPRVFVPDDVLGEFSSFDEADNIAATASLATSYVSPWRRLSAITNKTTHKSSLDRNGGAYGNWRGAKGFGQTDWVIFSWDEAQLLVGFEVYWWNNVDSEILVPNSAVLEFWDGATWVTLGNIGVALDHYNRIEFASIATTSIRVSMSSDRATGILEARVFADNGNSPFVIPPPPAPPPPPQ